jgi:hypothetical protein
LSFLEFIRLLDCLRNRVCFTVDTITYCFC